MFLFDILLFNSLIFTLDGIRLAGLRGWLFPYITYFVLINGGILLCRDILRELATGVGVTVPSDHLQPQKRRRDDEGIRTEPKFPSGPSNSQPRAVAGSKRAEQYHQSTLSSLDNIRTTDDLSNFFGADFEFSLPVHSEDLGRIPVASGLADFDLSSAGPSDWSIPLESSTFNGNTLSHLGTSIAPEGLQPNGLDAIFNGLVPGSYEDAFAAFTQSSPTFAQQLFADVGSVDPVFSRHGPLHSASTNFVDGQSFAHDTPQLWNERTSGTG